MKNYRQLVKELPAKTIVFSFGRFSPPTIGHELLFKVVKKTAANHNADHVIYASRTQDKKKNPLSIDRKMHFLKIMFKDMNFAQANDDARTFIEAVKLLNKKYKNLIMVAGSDRVPEYEKLLNKYNGKEFKYDTIQVVSAGERDPDSDNASGMSASKMRAIASKGDYPSFKKGLPNTVRDIDGKILMNDIRTGMGLDPIKEEVRFNVDTLREKYFKGEIYHIGDLVESAGVQYEIMDRGSNYLVVVDESGELHRKWIKDISIMENKNGLWANIHAKRKRIKAGSGERMRKPGSDGAPSNQDFKDSQVKEDIQPGYAPKEITYKGYTTKNLHHSADAAKAFQSTIERADKGLVPNDPVAILNALKSTDAYMKLNDMHLEQGKAPDDTEVQQWIQAHDAAKKTLEKIGEFPHHLDYWNSHKTELQFMGNDFKETGKSEFNEELTNKTIKPNTDKIKVARIIADMLGIENAEKSSSPEQLVNTALRSLKTKVVNKDLLKVVSKMLDLATEVGIKFDRNLRPQKLKEAVVVDKNSKRNFANDILRYSDYLKLNKMNKGEVKQNEVELDLPHTTPGHTMETDPHLRRRKVKYRTEETEIEEDVATSDYKVNKDGRKYRAHKVNFANSKANSKPDDTPNEDEDETEYKKYLKTEAIVKIGKVAPVKDDSAQLGNHNTKGFDAFFQESELEIDDKELDKMADGVNHEDHVLDLYDDNELALVDDETGEEIKEEFEESEQLVEVLSKIERMRSRMRFSRTQSKRTRRMKIALHKHSSTPVINNRARRLAISLIKKRLAKKPLNKLSVGEKERLERTLEKRKQLVNRLAMRLVPRIRTIEKNRLSHTKHTKGTNTSVGF